MQTKIGCIVTILLLLGWISILFRKEPVPQKPIILRLDPVTVLVGQQCFGGLRVMLDVTDDVAYEDFFDEEKVVIDYESETLDDVIPNLSKNRIVDYLYELDLLDVINRVSVTRSVEITGRPAYTGSEWRSMFEGR